MSAKKHFSEVEKSVFVQILKDHKCVIETKISNAVGLKKKQEAWLKITADYNSSALVSQERTVKQLKKLWSNLKQGQRDLLTKERQETFATGGGPEEPKGSIDPNIAAIVPNLPENAPVLFSSNLPETVVRERRQELLGVFEDPDHDEDSDEEEQLPLEMPLKSEDIFEADYEVKQSPELVSPGSSRTEVSTAGFTRSKTSLSPGPSKKRKLETRQRATLESVNAERVENVIRQENLMFELKLEHQKKWKELEFQKKAHEVREAKARADLAEARLEKEINAERVENVIRQENLMFELKLEHQKKWNELELQKKAQEVREAKARADLAEASLEKELNN